MASVFVLLEAFNRKEAAALGFFPCATASFYSFKMQQEAPISGASCCVKKENAALYWPR